jgi:hypothetical protein
VHVVRVSENCWLTLSESIEPAYMIIYGPAVHQSTGETHLIYKIVRHNLRKEDRWTVGWAATLADAVEVCRRRLETPLFVAPARAPDGGVVTQDEQRERWLTGRDSPNGHLSPDRQAPTFRLALRFHTARINRGAPTTDGRNQNDQAGNRFHTGRCGPLST